MKFFLIIFLLFFACDEKKTNNNKLLNEIYHKVTKDSLLSYVEKLASFNTRYFNRSEKIDARDWISSKMKSFGYLVKFEQFDHKGEIGYNIIAIKENFDSNRSFIIFDAHYDSYARNKLKNDQGIAPGANDNASGVATLIEAARVFKDYNIKVPIKFIFFDGEEHGLIGSTFHVNQAFFRGDKIEFVFNIDMIGGFSEMKHQTIVCEEDRSYPETNNSRSKALNAELEKIITEYTTLDTYIGGAFSSDYIPFQDKGHVILGLYEYRGQEGNPNYDNSSDTFENVHQDYFFEAAKGAITFLAKKSL
jgi:aminopeptidase YwaD